MSDQNPNRQQKSKNFKPLVASRQDSGIFNKNSFLPVPGSQNVVSKAERGSQSRSAPAAGGRAGGRSLRAHNPHRTVRGRQGTEGSSPSKGGGDKASRGSDRARFRGPSSAPRPLLPSFPLPSASERARAPRPLD